MRSATCAIVVASLSLVACAETPPIQGVLAHKPGTSWDPDEDGNSDGIFVDTNGDGRSDGIDTNGDGVIDLDVFGNPIKTGDGDGDSPAGDGDDDDDTGDSDDDGTCEEHVVRNDRLPPEMLIVLDRSGSMDTNGECDRWCQSVNALKSSTAALQDQIRFGLMAFPGAAKPQMMQDCSGFPIWDPKRWQCEGQNAGWGNSDECEAGSIAVPAALNTAAMIASSLDSMSPRGSTPTAASLAAAHTLLGSVDNGLDGVRTPKFVLLVTDGEPTCNSSVQDAVDEIEKLAMDGIKTYVIGYELSGNAASGMDMMAMAGDTGATAHIRVENQASLQMALEDIAGKIASCTITLEKPVDDPSYVLVTIDDTIKLGLNQKDGNGFSVGPDSQTVTIEGASCNTLRSGTDHKVHVEVQCTPVLL